MASNWDLVGYSDLDRKLGKRIPPGQVLIPGKIWLENDYLNWHLSPNAWFETTSKAPQKRLLNEFARLWSASDARILAFARANGVLWRNPNEVESREPLEQWRRLSRKVCALLNIGAELRLGKKRIDRDEWKYIALYEDRRLDELTLPAATRFELRREISGAWLRDSGFSMQWSRKNARFELEIDYRGVMLNAVGLQLALTLSNSDSLYICSGCSLPYARSRDKRQPKAGQSNFCEECGTAVALRQADRRRKAKVTAARQLHAKGVPVEEVAERLGIKMTTARAWCRKNDQEHV